MIITYHDPNFVGKTVNAETLFFFDRTRGEIRARLAAMGKNDMASEFIIVTVDQRMLIVATLGHN